MALAALDAAAWAAERKKVCPSNSAVAGFASALLRSPAFRLQGRPTAVQPVAKQTAQPMHASSRNVGSASKRRKLTALQQADPVLQDHPELTDDLQLKAILAEQRIGDVGSAISNAAVDAAASAGLPEAEHLQQQRSKRRALKAQKKAREQMIYKISAIVASAGVCTAAIGAVYIRFAWNMGDLGERQFPVAQAVATLLLTFGGVVGMEMWARWAHQALWHDFQPGWALHKSHHEPRVGPFEDNDIFAIINAVPAFALCLYGFITPTLLGGICFGAGLGITLFGIMYMFIHDGMVHKRFPVGPIAEVPYLQRVAAAHRLHHAERHNGVPWGMFLGPQELEAVGGKEDLDKLCKSMFPKK